MPTTELKLILYTSTAVFENGSSGSLKHHATRDQAITDAETSYMGYGKKREGLTAIRLETRLVALTPELVATLIKDGSLYWGISGILENNLLGILATETIQVEN